MKNYIFTPMPITELISPTKEGYFFRMTNRWWVVTENDEVLFYGPPRSPYMSPQCNLNKSITDRFRHFPEEFKVRGSELIPVAFQPIRIADYQE
jgi:hypothetical protein